MLILYKRKIYIIININININIYITITIIIIFIFHLPLNTQIIRKESPKRSICNNSDTFFIIENMTKIVIHTYPARLWYVNNFLVPSLIDQGLTDIIIFNDKYHIGNLMAFILSLKNIGDAWHLQDDVIISKDFAKRIKKYKNISCGFCAEGFQTEIVEGTTNIKNMWYSFPCLFIPGNIAEEFYSWFKDQEKNIDFIQMINTGKMDDLIFKEYLQQKHPDMLIDNIVPNLVDHIDFLIGGSICNKARKKIARAKYFPDPELVKDLESRVLEFKIQNNLPL